MPVVVTWQGTSPKQLLETCKTHGIVSTNKSVTKNDGINIQSDCLYRRIGFSFMKSKQLWMLLRHQTGFKRKIMLEKYIGSTSLQAKLRQLRQFQNICNQLWISIANLQVSWLHILLCLRTLMLKCFFPDNARTCNDPWILFRDVKGEIFFYSLEAQGIYNEAQFSVLSAIKQDTESGSLLKENQLAKMAKIEAENKEMMLLKRMKREKVERARRHYVFTRCSKIFNAFRLLAMENGKCLKNAHQRILSQREETMSKCLLAWKTLSSMFRASRKKTLALCNNVSAKACSRVFVEWREFTIIAHRNTYTALFMERWKYICVSRFRREENKRRATALRAKMLKRAWLKCWHDEYLIEKSARLVVQNEAAVKIQVLYRDYRTRSKTAQLLAQKKKALLAKFVQQGNGDVHDHR